MILPLAILTFLITLQLFLEVLANILNIKNAIKLEGKSERVLYLQANTRLTYVNLLVNYSLYIVFLLLRPFNIGNKILLNFDNFYLIAIYSALFFITLNFALSLALSYVKVFKIEGRFGFNNMKQSLFFLDKIKGLFLEIALVIPTVLIATYTYQKYKLLLPVALYLLFQLVTLFIYLFGVRYILPLFNKLEELPQGELRSKLESLLKEVSFPLSKLSVINASKRNSKGNAFFSGMGKVKNIVLYDTLMDLLTPNEITAVLAHEIGHYKLKHTFRNYLTQSIGALTFSITILLFLQPNFTAYLLPSDSNNLVNQVILIFLIFSTLSFYPTLLNLKTSRKYELEADLYASNLGYASDLISGLNKLSSHAKSNPLPHGLYVSLYYSHPPTKVRTERLN
jgi:STE24 endopeptidase